MTKGNYQLLGERLSAGSGIFIGKGFSPSLSHDGSIVSVGALQHIARQGKRYGGYVKVFQTVMESQMEAKFGNSISMSSNGLVLAVGALHYTGSSEEQGMVKVFHFQENNWASYMKIFLCEL